MLTSRGYWVLMALFGMGSFTFMLLLMKRLTQYLPTPLLLLYLFAVTTIMYLGLNLKRGLPLQLPNFTIFCLIVLCSFLSFAGNIGQTEAMRTAPNPGYAEAIIAGNVVLLTLISAGSAIGARLTITGICGVLLVFSGVVILALEKN